MFKDRVEAGELLAEKLKMYQNAENTVVVTIPRGGLPIGYSIAKKLNLPLDIVLSKKIGYPFNKEFAIGAVTLHDRILSDTAHEVSQVYLDDETQRIRSLLKERQELYYKTKKPLNLKHKTVIIVDDGVATGQTLISSIKLIEQQKPHDIIVGLPVGPPSVIKKLKNMPEVSNVVCLLVPENFRAVGQFYKAFYPVDDADVIRLLNEEAVEN